MMITTGPGAAGDEEESVRERVEAAGLRTQTWPNESAGHHFIAPLPRVVAA
jgi:hypothetical protein